MLMSLKSTLIKKPTTSVRKGNRGQGVDHTGPPMVDAQQKHD